MGASTFITTAKGKTAEEAFRAAREEALYECGHGRYTGSIAEKCEFIMIRDDGRALKARMAQAIGIVREAIEQIRAGERTALTRAEVQQRAGVHLEIDGWAIEHGSKAHALKALRAEVKRLTELKKRCRVRMNAEAIADLLIAFGDSRTDDKHGPAGCIDLTPKKKRDKEFAFFGWASS